MRTVEHARPLSSPAGSVPKCERDCSAALVELAIQQSRRILIDMGHFPSFALRENGFVLIDA